MKKTERIANLETAIYILALTAARDKDTTQDKEVLGKIRDYMSEICTLKNGNPNLIVLGTAGLSEADALKVTKDFDKEEE